MFTKSSNPFSFENTSNRERANSFVLERPPKTEVSRKKLSFDDVEFENNDSTKDCESLNFSSCSGNMKKIFIETSSLDIFQNKFWSSPRSEIFSPECKSNSHRSFGLPPLLQTSSKEEIQFSSFFSKDRMVIEDFEDSKENYEAKTEDCLSRERSTSMPMFQILTKNLEFNSSCFSTPRDIDSAGYRRELEGERARTTESSSQFLQFNQDNEECPKHLPTTCKNIKYPDLTGITAETLENLIQTNDNLRYLIVDCRYDYEYEGGHIQGAINVTSPRLLEEIFFTKRHLLDSDEFLNSLKSDFHGTLASKEFQGAGPENPEYQSTKDPLIVIFHCEFSQKRGPRALRAFRNFDRLRNEHRFPKLHYPEIYILDGGYENLVKGHPEVCEPKGSYIQMLDPRYKIEYSNARDFELKQWQRKKSLDVLFEANEGSGQNQFG